MPDFHCYPVWDDKGGYPFDPGELPITPELEQKLLEWQRTYDATFDPKYPPDSAFSSVEAKQLFVGVGYRLWRELRRELGPNYLVVYRDRSIGETLTPEDDPLPEASSMN